jgi:hypothetical protein
VSGVVEARTQLALRSLLALSPEERAVRLAVTGAGAAVGRRGPLTPSEPRERGGDLVATALSRLFGGASDPIGLLG